MNFVEAAGRSASQMLYSRSEAQEHFRRASQAATLPFIYLSEGVSNETFADALAIAAEAGSSFCGVLCGRAIWQDGVEVFVRNGEAGLQDWLREHGVRNIQNVNASLAAARPWSEKVSIQSLGKG
jgi:tagatose 1,6-diphosphate aldolase